MDILVLSQNLSDYRVQSPNVLSRVILAAGLTDQAAPQNGSRNVRRAPRGPTVAGPTGREIVYLAMGKLPINPRSDTRDNLRRTSREERVATTGAVIVGGAVSRSSAASSAIADSAAADRDRRLHVRDVVDNDTSSGGCTGRRPARDRPISEIVNNTDPIDVIVGALGDSQTRWRCGDAVATRLRRNTWHADRPEDEAAVKVAGLGAIFGTSDSNVEKDRVTSVSSVPGTRRWNARIAPGDDRTCCSTDVAYLHARRARDRVIRAGPNSKGRVAERRNRRSCSCVLSAHRGRSIGTPIDIPETDRILRGAIDSITVVNAARGGCDRYSTTPTDTMYVPDGDLLSKGTVTKASELAANSRSPISVLEAGESIRSDGVNTERVPDASFGDRGNSVREFSPHRNGPVARLIEIGIGDFSHAKRSRCHAEETTGDATTATSSLGKTIARTRVPDESRLRRTKTDTCWRLSAARVGFVLRTLLLGLLARSLLCNAVLGAPSSALIDLDGSIVFEDDVEELLIAENDLRESELEIIRKNIVQGLGLQRIPDASKANVSQVEYERAHRKYLKQVQLSHDGQESRKRRSLHVFEPAERPGNNRPGLAVDDDYDDEEDVSDWRRNHRHTLYFPVVIPDEEENAMVDHASLRFLLQGDYRRPRKLEVLVHLRTPVSRRLLLRNRIPQMSLSQDSRWLELDSTEIASIWLERSLDENHGLELEFLHDGEPTRREISHARLNVFTTSETEDDDDGARRQKRSTPEEVLQRHERRSDCRGYNNKRCCRHEMTVMFKDLKGFDFIVYPKSFDAGYCKGRCPPLYNPAHHHALLQSLLWKEDRKRIPKPCCAPSKLNQLMVVYFDEQTPTELQVSYWHNITVDECACS